MCMCERKISLWLCYWIVECTKVAKTFIAIVCCRVLRSIHFYLLFAFATLFGSSRSFHFPFVTSRYHIYTLYIRLPHNDWICFFVLNSLYCVRWYWLWLRLLCLRTHFCDVMSTIVWIHSTPLFYCKRDYKMLTIDK